MGKDLDVVIFGATGFTGKYAVQQAIQVLKDLKWGVAGRNKEKLEKTLRDVEKKTNEDLKNIPIILADVNDENSLKEMAERCKVVVNCCGPYHLYGEPVVKACIDAGAHQVDITGETQYMELMQLKYDQLAKEKGVFIVPACGMDCIPSDTGIIFAEDNFEGTVNSVEGFLELYIQGGYRGGAMVHYGTWESAVYLLANASESKDLRAKLLQGTFIPDECKLKERPLIFKSSVANAYCLPFPGGDESCILRSQAILWKNEKKRPVQAKLYLASRSLIETLATIFLGIIFWFLIKFECGQKLLLKYPRLLSLGLVSHEGPSEELMERTKLRLTLHAKGWPKDEKLSEPTDKHTKPPSKTLVAQVTGKNPGYIGTAVSILVSAVTILKESDKMPGSGGVLPPGAAFARTSLIKRLDEYEYGFKFVVISKD